MKKQLVMLMAMVFMTGLVTNVAVAADNLKISGTYFLQGWMKDNYSDGDDDNDLDKGEYWSQRLRAQVEFIGSEQIKAVARFDMAETTWGSDNMQVVRPAAGTNEQFQLDRAYLDVTKDNFNFRGGLQYFSTGHSIVFRDNQPGLLLKINTPVKLTLGYIKRDESGSTSDEEVDGTNYGDTNRYLVEAQYNINNIEIKGFSVLQIDDSDAEDEPYVIGISGKYISDFFKITAELDTFGGSKGDIDYVGTQLFADVNMKINEYLSLAIDMIYSTGEDEADEEKLSYMGNPFGYQRVTEGGWGVDLADGFLLPLDSGDIFDPKNGNAGSIGLGIAAKFTPIEKIDLYGQLFFLTAEEDVANAYDTATVINLGAVYTVLPKCKLTLYYNNTSLTAQTGDDSDPASCIFTEIRIAF